MEELKSLLKEIGLPSAVTGAIIIAVAIVVFFAQRALKNREKQKAERRKTLHDYARLQEEALFKAYRRLYEDVDINALSPNEFRQVISQADELIME